MKDFTFTTEQFLDFLAEKQYFSSYAGLLAGQNTQYGPETKLSNRDLLSFLDEEFNLIDKFESFPEFIPTSWIFYSFGKGKLTLEESASSFDTDFFIDMEPLIEQLLSNTANLSSKDGYNEIYYSAEAHINDALDKNSFILDVLIDNVEIKFTAQQEAEILEFLIESFKEEAYHYEFIDDPADITVSTEDSSYEIKRKSTGNYAEYLSDKALQNTVWIFNENELFDPDAKICRTFL